MNPTSYKKSNPCEYGGQQTSLTTTKKPNISERSTYKMGRQYRKRLKNNVLRNEH